MPPISNDLVNRLNAAQAQIWQSVGAKVSEASGQPISFLSPLTVSAQTADLYGEFGAPLLMIQFSLAELPDNPLVVLLPHDTIQDLASVLAGRQVEDIDEAIIAEIRTPLEAIVQGICLAAGDVRNEAIVASGLSIKYQIFAFPSNFQSVDELIRCQVAVSGPETSGTAIWLLDAASAHALMGMSEETEGNPFPQSLGDSTAARSAEESNGLELLMDIPLEITVELGRVKMLVRDVVELGTGSIIEIDKAAGEPVDVMVNGKLVARGEVVVIEDNFGVRITEILNPQERITKIGEAA